MGKAVIVESIGEGLYLARPVYNNSGITTELNELKLQRDKYYLTLFKAQYTVRLLKEDVTIALGALNQIIVQWKQALIDKMKTAPPIPPSTPNDPDTGEPWVDQDRAQEPLLLEAINQPHLTRNAVLDGIALKYLKQQAVVNKIGHLDWAGNDVGVRATRAGYRYLFITEILMYGEPSIDDVMNTLNREYSTQLSSGNYTEIGIAYVSSSNHFAGHLWCVILAKPDLSPEPDQPGTVVESPPDPSKDKALTEEAKLDKITAPKLDDLSPDQLGKVSQAYGIAIAKLRVAEREIDKIVLENIERGKRITELEGIVADKPAIHVWCVSYDGAMVVGSVVNSIEIPGFWKDEGVARTTVLYKDIPERRTTVNWVERSWNLAARGISIGEVGSITSAEGLTAAAVFINCALEPGHLKWKPQWRYGTITSKTGGVAAVNFSEELVRPLSDEAEMSLQQFYNHVTVPIRYPPCGSDVFSVNDEVVVLFEGTNRDQPVIIGFRREPKSCSGRISWAELY